MMPDGSNLSLPAVIPNTLDGLFREVERLHLGAQRSSRDALAQGIAAGRLLRKAKAQCPPGQWGKRLGQLPVPRRTLTHYMHLARHEQLLVTKMATVATGDLSVRGALQVIREAEAEKKEPFSLKSPSGYSRPAEHCYLSSTSIWELKLFREKSNMRWKDFIPRSVVLDEAVKRFNKHRDASTVYSGCRSIFDPWLTETTYLRWAGEKPCKILDLFAGDLTRGLVADVMGFRYVGLDCRRDQIDENNELAKKLGLGCTYVLGDARDLNCVDDGYDMIFTCPPFGPLERYSDLPQDLSNMPYAKHREAMGQVAQVARAKLRAGGLACLVVADFDDPKTGEHVNFIGHTIAAFEAAGFKRRRKIVIAKNQGSAPVRAASKWKTQDVVGVDERLLRFVAPGAS
jgi:hypothetical protein